MNLKEYKNKLLKNPEFRKEYSKIDLGMEISLMVMEARIIAGITQENLARLVKTKQPSIARLENGKYLPSLNFLQKIARALGTYLVPPKFGIVEDFNKYLVQSKVKRGETGFSDFLLEPKNYVQAYLLREEHNSYETKVL